MGTTPVCQITSAGCVRPAFADCLTYVQTAYRSIYGQDTYLGADSQDGQFTALVANAIHDANGETLAAYNSRSPGEAQGAGLSSVVKINGIRRKSATFSTSDFLNIGQAGITIAAGALTDVAGNRWSLPTFTIPNAGQILVTGVCETLGDVSLPAFALDTANGKGSIATPQLGWQSAVNPSTAAVGQPVETDSQLRQRQAISTQIPSQSLFEGLIGAVSAITGVIRVKGYENDGNASDANGLPGHAICLVVDGGDASTIAALIARKKGSAGTFGNTVVNVVDTAGVSRPIAFSRSSAVAVGFALTIRSLGNYTQGVDGMVKQALADFTNGLAIGEDVDRDAAYLPAKFNGAAIGKGYEITRLAIGRDGVTPAQSSVAIAYDERATCDVSAITVTVTR